jgi:hypothetical protein
MFLLGSTGTLLPYIITLIALWSGVLLGYGNVLTSKNPSSESKEIAFEQKSVETSSLAYYIHFVEKIKSEKIQKVSSGFKKVYFLPIVKIKPVVFSGKDFPILLFNIRIAPTRGSPLL